jgi:ATP-dependent DNA ligase
MAKLSLAMTTAWPRSISSHHRVNDSIFLYAFDLIELNGDDLRRDPLQVRKATLASILAKASPGIRFNEHIEDDGPTVFAHACKLGLEGMVSKRKDSTYRSARQRAAVFYVLDFKFPRKR